MARILTGLPAVRAGFVVAGALLALGLAAGPAQASVLQFNFGTTVSNSGLGTCSSSGNCNLGSNQVSYTQSGVTVGADSYATSGNTISSANTDVSQRFVTPLGSNGADESGLGVFSGTDSISNGSSLEISSSEYLLIDNSNAINQGYTLASISLGSIQSGEGGAIDIYGASSVGSTLDPTKLTLLASLQNPPNVATLQTYDFAAAAAYDYLVITASNPSSSTGNVLVQQVSYNSPQSVPEPGTLALMGTFLVGFVLLRRRRFSA